MVSFKERHLNLLKFLNTFKKIDSKTKFQKLVFLAKKEYNLDLGYDFKQYNYGPYSEELSLDIEALKQLGFINVKEEIISNLNENNYPIIRYEFEISDLGKELVNNSKSDLNINNNLLSWNKKELRDIISYVYDKYVD